MTVEQAAAEFEALLQSIPDQAAALEHPEDLVPSENQVIVYDEDEDAYRDTAPAVDYPQESTNIPENPPDANVFDLDSFHEFEIGAGDADKDLDHSNLTNHG